ncbi:c-type cytochrome [Stieleria sp. ICT_E10.1]|uniref:PVC-type heme-binding CxxCH protein n=1 Tax=Stieleria sedimenti TaxID=2976331 RepID=UPI00217FBD3E|nr:PVC-type heme-binding CxxCH protein [Stieleria sedimenti]MCS7470475.1 c-type cytochrome [Stieleria sedimenti]
MIRLSYRLFLPCLAALLSLTPTPAADFADQLPRIAPTEPGDTLDDFRVADGYQIQLVAAEPLVNSPVAIEWDADGALFVCEMRGYSEDRDDKLSRITRLIDTDDDGVFDHHTVYADNLLWPTALFPYDGGLFVADAPDIFYLKDHDGDGIADSKKVVFTGFSIGNVQGLLNSFRWGLDNRIHLACGTVGGKVRRTDQDESTAVEVRGHDMAFDPKTDAFTLTSGGAQHGMCFDDWGRKFVSSNSDHLQQVMYEDRYIKRNPLLVAPSARQSIAADGPQAEVFRISPVEPWRVVRTRLRVAGLVRGPIEGGGRAAGYFTGATGVTIYRGDAWPKDDHSLALVGDVGSNLIHRKRLTPAGVQLVGERMDAKSEFVASKDNWFRPAQFACGPDGALSVVDVYREVIEHPKSLPPEIKQHVDLTSGRHRGRIYRVVPDGYHHRPTPKLNTFDTESLAKLLQHPNAWHRETAARLIHQRQDKTIAETLRRQAGQSSSAQGRLHSLYALDGLGLLKPEDVTARFDDRHPQVVRHAIRLAERFASDEDIVGDLKRLVRHPSIDVRYQLAFSLGEFSFQAKSDWLAALALQNPTDRWIQTAVSSSTGGQPDRLFAALLKSDFVEPLAPFLLRLSSQIDRGDETDQRRRSLFALVSAGHHPSLLPALGRLNRADRRELIGGELYGRAESLAAGLISMALAQVAETKRSDAERVRAIGWLTDAPIDQIFPTLVKVLRQSESSELQLAVIGALDRSDSPELVEILLEPWPTWSPRLRSAAGDVLFTTAKRSAAVLDAIDAGTIDAADISLPRWNALASSRDSELRKRAERYLATTKGPSRDAVIAQYQETFQLAGDAQRGAEVFKKQCAGCHQSGDVGHAIGPSLAAAATRGGESILTNVLDPNREVNPQYVNYVVLTTDGRTAAGMIASENANSITLRRAENVSDTILRQDIELLRNTNQSIMPEGFEKAIPPQAMADLIEYLITSVNTSTSGKR